MKIPINRKFALKANSSKEEIRDVFRHIHRQLAGATRYEPKSGLSIHENHFADKDLDALYNRMNDGGLDLDEQRSAILAVCEAIKRAFSVGTPPRHMACMIEEIYRRSDLEQISGDFRAAINEVAFLSLWNLRYAERRAQAEYGRRNDPDIKAKTEKNHKRYVQLYKEKRRKNPALTEWGACVRVADDLNEVSARTIQRAVKAATTSSKTRRKNS